MRAATDEEIRKHFWFMDIADYCCKCLNYETRITRVKNEDGSVVNQIYCARQNTCPLVQRELAEQERGELYGK